MWGGQFVLFGYIVCAINQGEIYYQDKQEDWGNSEKHMKFWHKKIYRKDKLGKHT